MDNNLVFVFIRRVYLLHKIGYYIPRSTLDCNIYLTNHPNCLKQRLLILMPKVRENESSSYHNMRYLLDCLLLETIKFQNQ